MSCNEINCSGLDYNAVVAAAITDAIDTRAAVISNNNKSSSMAS